MAIVIVSGVILALWQVDPLAALRTTTCGVVLLVKAGVVAGAVAVGFWAYRRYVRGDSRRESSPGNCAGGGDRIGDGRTVVDDARPGQPAPRR